MLVLRSFRFLKKSIEDAEFVAKVLLTGNTSALRRLNQNQSKWIFAQISAFFSSLKRQEI